MQCKNCRKCTYYNSNKCIILTAPALTKTGECAFFKTEEEKNKSEIESVLRLIELSKKSDFYYRKVEKIIEAYPSVKERIKTCNIIF